MFTSKGRQGQFLVSQGRASVGKQLSTEAPETRNLVYVTNNPLREKLEYFLHYKSKYFSGLVSPSPDETFHNPADL